eukprot:gb/GECG01013487.1/.p1 GENE.gb/GECG01013487.1/~~gb/GECG01013487.1/.p1  ORF type:complete len:112 (+),score=10.30 gb/GECG01013487.1/:1-336(+)
MEDWIRPLRQTLRKNSMKSWYVIAVRCVLFQNNASALVLFQTRVGCRSEFIWLSQVLHVEPVLHLSLGFTGRAEDVFAEGDKSSKTLLFTTLLHFIESNLHTSRVSPLASS